MGRHVGSIIDAMIDISSRFKSTTVSTFVSRSCVSAESMVDFMTASNRVVTGDANAAEVEEGQPKPLKPSEFNAEEWVVVIDSIMYVSCIIQVPAIL